MAEILDASGIPIPEDVLKAAAPVTKQSTTVGSTFETASGINESTASGDSTDNVFYQAYAVYLEGIEVPCSAVSISYGISGIPTCTITLPASSIIRDLPYGTKIAVFIRDQVPNNDGKYEWRLMFDGEYLGYGYSVVSSGASVSLTFMHNAAHMHSMQLMLVDMTEFWLYKAPQFKSGDAVLVSMQGFNKPTKTILSGLLNKDMASKYKSMADIVYTLVRTVLADVKNTPTGRYYKKKFGDMAENGDGGYKLLRRFYGINDDVKSIAIPESKDIGKPIGESSSPTGEGSGARYLPPSSTPATTSVHYKNGTSGISGESDKLLSDYPQESINRLDSLTDSLNQKYQMDGPLTLYSARRSTSENENAGGSSTSNHIQGNAFDIALDHNGIALDQDAVINQAKAAGFNEIIVYTHESMRFVHVGRDGNGLRILENKGSYGNAGTGYIAYVPKRSA